VISIDLYFQRFCDISLSDVYDQTGVYIIWNGKALVRPTYIGEGNVLRRFADHIKKPWAVRPIDGVMAFIEGVTERRKKAYAELAEVVLLLEADRINRYPTQNQAPGKVRAALRKTLRAQGHNIRTIRLHISGCDPFVPPERSSNCEGKVVVLRETPDGNWKLAETCWNVRT
jgi:hypothetical protein